MSQLCLGRYNSLSILLATLGKPVCDLAVPRLSARRKSKQKRILRGSISGVNIDMAGARQYVMKRKKSSFPCGELKLLTHSISLSLVSRINS